MTLNMPFALNRNPARQILPTSRLMMLWLRLGLPWNTPCSGVGLWPQGFRKQSHEGWAGSDSNGLTIGLPEPKTEFPLQSLGVAAEL